eukprot:5605229-Amphidinium_carterae.1
MPTGTGNQGRTLVAGVLVRALTGFCRGAGVSGVVPVRRQTVTQPTNDSTLRALDTNSVQQAARRTEHAKHTQPRGGV